MPSRRQPAAPSLDRPYVVKGTHIGFKTLHKEDAATAVGWFQNLEMITHLSNRGRPETVESETAFFERALKNEDGAMYFAIFELKRDRLIGSISLFDIRPANHATLGICIGDPTCWSRGYGTEAVKLMVAYGFYFLNLHNIRLGHFGYNRRAGRAYEKAGFKPVGRFRGTILLGGKRYDDVWMDITRDEADLSDMRRLSGVVEA
jgi:RimJ/RimL family protein N-acetyltransferase